VRVLVATHNLFRLAGSELVTLELAKELSRQGHEVSVATFVFGHPIGPLFEQAGLRVLNLFADDLRGQSFDLVWAHHSPVLDRLLFGLDVVASRIVCRSLSPFAPLETPPAYGRELSLILANSAETRDEMATIGFGDCAIELFPNSLPEAYFDQQPKAHRPQAERIAIISNHLPQELLALAEQLDSLDVIGAAHRVQLVDPELLRAYDAVISIGRTVQQCLALGTPVFCYDHFGGPGWILPEVLPRAERYNFSGRCTPVERSAPAILEALKSGYRKATNAAAPLAQVARARYRLKDNVTQVLSQIESKTPVDIARLRKQHAPVARYSAIYLEELSRRLMLQMQLSRS